MPSRSSQSLRVAKGLMRLMGGMSMNVKTNCWMWTKRFTEGGHPLVWMDGKWRRADRLTYSLVNGLNVDVVDLSATIKKCGKQACCNPAHMELVPKRHANRNALKTHCRHGHKFTEHNTYVQPNGSRQCKICRNKTNRNRKGKLNNDISTEEQSEKSHQAQSETQGHRTDNAWQNSGSRNL